MDYSASPPLPREFVWSHVGKRETLWELCINAVGPRLSPPFPGSSWGYLGKRLKIVGIDNVCYGLPRGITVSQGVCGS